MASIIGTINCNPEFESCCKRKQKNDDDESEDVKPRKFVMKKKKEKPKKNCNVVKIDASPPSVESTEFSLASSTSDQSNPPTFFQSHFESHEDKFLITSVPKYLEFSHHISSIFMLDATGNLIMTQGSCARKIAPHKTTENVLERWHRIKNFIFIYMHNEAIKGKGCQIQMSNVTTDETYLVSSMFFSNSLHMPTKGSIFTFLLIQSNV